MTSFLLGAHLDNRQPPQSSYDRLRLMRAEAAVTLCTPETHHDSDVYRALRDAGVRSVVIRVGDERLVDAATFLKWCNAAYASARGIFPDAAIAFQALNEVNLSDATPEQLAAFLVAVRAGWTLPCRLLMTPLSMGAANWRAYLGRLLAALPRPLPFDGVAVHPYAGNVSQLGPFLVIGLPVVVTEFSHPGLSGTARAAWSLAQAQGWAAQGVESACQFIVDGEPYGAWDPNYRMTDDEARALGKRGAIEEAAVPATDMVDLSSNNGDGVDLTALKAAGIVLVGMKASQGASYADPTFPIYWPRAAEQGQGRLAYFFWNPDDPELGSTGNEDETSGLFAKQIERVGGLGRNDLIAGDFEAGNGNQLDRVCRVLELVEDRCGVRPGKYSARWWTRAHGVESSDLAKYWSWWANYEATMGPLPVGWENVLIWQTGTGAVAGVPGVFDLDRLLVPLPDLLARGYQGGSDVIQLNDADKAAYLALTGQAWSAAEGIAAILAKYGAEGQSAAEWVDQGIKAPVVLSKELTGTNR